MIATSHTNEQQRYISQVHPARGAYWSFLRYEIKRIVSNRQRFLLSLLPPIILYLSLYRVVGDGVQLPNGDVAAWMMIGIGVYGAAIASTSTASAVSIERSTGWLRTIHISPLSAFAYTSMKACASVVMASVPVITVGILGVVTGVQAAPQVWIIGLLVAWLGSIIFAALGLVLGLVLKPEIVIHMPGLIMTALAFIGNLFVPLKGIALTLSTVTPLYGVVTVARYPLTEGYSFDGTHASLGVAIANMVVWAGIFLAASAYAFKKGTGRT